MAWAVVQSKSAAVQPWGIWAYAKSRGMRKQPTQRRRRSPRVPLTSWLALWPPLPPDYMNVPRERQANRTLACRISKRDERVFDNQVLAVCIF